ncbi:MAG: hypothetical protein R2875_12260 [Desulfobacterales bacterium]
MNKPMGVVVNRAGLGNLKSMTTAPPKSGYPGGNPHDRQIAEAYASGVIISESSDKMKQIFLELAEK